MSAALGINTFGKNEFSSSQSTIKVSIFCSLCTITAVHIKVCVASDKKANILQFTDV